MHPTWTSSPYDVPSIRLNLGKECARAEIQPTILPLAADAGLDLLVMGGYGHSRLQERVLGGVTRAMLEAMTVPTLMSD